MVVKTDGDNASKTKQISSQQLPHQQRPQQQHQYQQQQPPHQYQQQTNHQQKHRFKYAQRESETNNSQNNKQLLKHNILKMCMLHNKILLIKNQKKQTTSEHSPQ